MTYSVKELFKTLQGEGAQAGRAAVFCRFAGCNLWSGRESDRAQAACTFCDTDFVGTDGEGGGKFADARALAANIAACWGEGSRNRYVVFTGGEPLLQLDDALVDAVHAQGFTIAIETNGTIAPPLALDAQVAQYNVSPKLGHSGNPAELALIPERLAQWAGEPRAFFKFVVARPEDVAEAAALAERFAIPPERTYLMAEGTDTQTLESREAWLARACMVHGFNLSKRLHIQLFGDTRGT